MSRLRPSKLLCVPVLLRSSASPPTTRTATTPAASGAPGGNLGMGKMPPADRRDPRRPQFGRCLRGRGALPPARSTGTSHGDQRSPMHSPPTPVSLSNLQVRACHAIQRYLRDVSLFSGVETQIGARRPVLLGPRLESVFQYDSYRRHGVQMRSTASRPRCVPAIPSSRLQFPACAERAKRRQNSRGGKYTWE